MKSQKRSDLKSTAESDGYLRYKESDVRS